MWLVNKAQSGEIVLMDGTNNHIHYFGALVKKHSAYRCNKFLTRKFRWQLMVRSFDLSQMCGLSRWLVPLLD